MVPAKLSNRIALFGFLGVAAFFLWTEHRAHVLGALPYLLLFACPLMHLLHGGHAHGHDHSREDSEPHSERSGHPGGGLREP